MSKIMERDRARGLRREGISLGDIAKKLCVAKSSVSLWVRDIELTEDQLRNLRERLNIYKMGQVHSKKAKIRRDNSINRGIKKAEKDEWFRLICALYWAEGGKTAGAFMISNSDMDMVAVIIRWLFFAGYKDRIKFSVQYHEENGVSKNKLRAVWFEKIDIDESEIVLYKVKPRKGGKVKKVGRCPFGVGRIVIGSVDLFNEIMGGIELIKNRSVAQLV